MTIAIADIRIDGGTQSRAAINDQIVADYAEAMKAGETFPPVVTFFDGATYWLADGFHRYHAHLRSGAKQIAADIRQGTQRDAILFSVGANAAHGLRRTNDDKRRAVRTLLNDPEWSQWSANRIAKQCGVSHSFVNEARSSLETASSEKRTYTTKHGTQAEMNTAKIGKSERVGKAPPPVCVDLPLVDAGEIEAGEIEAPKPAAPEAIDPAEAKLRREFRALSMVGQEDAYVGLMLDLEEAKAKAKAQAAEIKALKDQVKAFEGDQAETIRRQAQLLRHKESEMYRANDKADKALARARVLEKRVAELEKMGIAV